MTTSIQRMFTPINISSQFFNVIRKIKEFHKHYLKFFMPVLDMLGSVAALTPQKIHKHRPRNKSISQA